MNREDAIAYAKEVYAACATVGCDNPVVRTLKALLDRHDEADVDTATILDVAKRAQREAIGWVSR